MTAHIIVGTFENHNLFLIFLILSGLLYRLRLSLSATLVRLLAHGFKGAPAAVLLSAASLGTLGMHAPATRRRAAEPHLAQTKVVEFGPVRNIANLPVLWKD